MTKKRFYLDVTSRIESVQLIQKLQHSTLNFTFTPGIRIVTLGTNGIDFVNENDRWRVFFGYSKKFSYQFRTITLARNKSKKKLFSFFRGCDPTYEVFLDQF